MMAVRAAVGLAALTGCASAAAGPGTAAPSPATARPDPSPPPSSPPLARPPAEATSAVRDAVAAADERAARTAGTRVGLAVLDRATGDLVSGKGAAEAFPAASIVKLYTAVDILHRAAAGAVTVTAEDRADIDAALRTSDDGAMNRLWDAFGGSDTVRRTIERVGLRDSRAPEDPAEWELTTISARDVVAVQDHVLTAMAPGDRDTIMSALRGATDRGADGFDQAFGLLDAPRPPGTAAKQGWMWVGSRFDLHSAGVSGSGDRYAVAILSESTAAAGPTAARDVVNDAAALMRQALDDV